MIGLLQELRQSRPLQTAILASFLWHLIWLFVIFIDVKDPAAKPKLEPKIYFVGPILSDDAFNIILETKPELSTTEYRTAEPLSSPSLEPQAQVMERANPGDLVSVPLGQSTWSSLRGRMKDDKPYPDALFRKKLRVDVVPKPFALDQGPLADRDLLSVPVFPNLPDRGDTPRVDPEFEMSVAGNGLVEEARMVVSSGDPETDLIIERYLRQWQFVPLTEGREGEVETGRVRVPADEARLAR